jgi:uncharacterized protein
VSDVVVTDSGPVIALSQIGVIELLPILFPAIVVPPAAHREIKSVAVPEWLHEQRLMRHMDARVVAATLDAGEREAISLALELSAAHVILDDRTGRAVAERLGLHVIGTLGVLLFAKQRGEIAAIRPYLDQLRSVDFFLDDRLYQRMLALAYEL